jgi:hypothetical protein
LPAWAKRQSEAGPCGETSENLLRLDTFEKNCYLSALFVAVERPSIVCTWLQKQAGQQKKEPRMKLRILILFVVSIGLARTALADTLRLKDGQVFYGQFVSRTSSGTQFTTQDGNTLFFLPQDVVSLTFAPAPAPQPPAASQIMTLQPGTEILVGLVDTLDTSTTQTGQVFSATLSTNLLANGYVVARTGTPVYGQVLDAKSAGRFSGKSQLVLQLTQLVINGNPVPIVTNTFDTEGKSSGKRSAFRLFGGAGLGAAIGAIAGNAGVGAAIGAVAGGVGSVVQKGNQVEIPSETQLQFILQQPVNLPAVQ